MNDSEEKASATLVATALIPNVLDWAVVLVDYIGPRRVEDDRDEYLAAIRPSYDGHLHQSGKRGSESKGQLATARKDGL